MQKLPKIPSWAPDWRFRSDYKNKIVDWIGSLPFTGILAKPQYAYFEDKGILACKGYFYDIIHAISDDTSEIKPSAGSIGRVIWENKWHRRKLIEYGLLSNLGTRLATVASLISRSHPLTYRRKLAKTKVGVLALVPREAQKGMLFVNLSAARSLLFSGLVGKHHQGSLQLKDQYLGLL